MISRLPLYLAAGGAIARRDLTIFLSYRASAASIAFGLVFQVALFYYISRLIYIGPELTPDSYFAFAVMGLAGLQVMGSTMNVAMSVQRELAIRSFERIVLSPFGVPASSFGMLIFPLIQALTLAALTIALAGLVFGMNVEWSTAPLAIPVTLLGALSLAPFGLMFAAVTIIFKQAPGRTMILALVSFAAGVYFPITLLPEWVQWFSEVQPLTPTLELMRHLIAGLPLDEPVWRSLLKVAGFTVLLLPIGIWLVVHAAKIARKRGTVLEY
jgi:ABC-type polysaccharide/polyol phosphate export permease